MRCLSLLALVALAAFPLSAHDHWRGPRPVVVVEGPRWAPHHRWNERRWERDRWERQEAYDRYGCDGDRVIIRSFPRPLAPPFVGRLELRVR